MKQIGECQKALPACRKALHDGLQEAIGQSANRPEIKAIYFEYYFDGSDASEGNFFLCTEYDTAQDSDWGAHFAAEDVLDGPKLQQLLTFDPELEWPALASHAASALGHADLLAQLGEIIDESGGCPLPVGYAEHDDSLVVHIAPTRG